jgi:hypothetical protein
MGYYSTLGLPSARLCTDCACAAAPTLDSTGLYVLGAVNTASCPARAYYIGSEAACRAAGTALNLAWGAAVNLATVPRWCSATTTTVYFNAHPIGAGFVTAQPLCLTSGTPAPTNPGDTNLPTNTPTRRPTNIGDTNPPTIGAHPRHMKLHAHVHTRECVCKLILARERKGQPEGAV